MATDSESTEKLVPTYAELFPALTPSAHASAEPAVFVVTKLRNVAESFAIPIEEQRYRGLDEKAFGNIAGRNRVCAEVANETDTKIDMSLSKDLSLSVCITGKRENVSKAKKLLLQKLQTQASFDLDIPKNLHSGLIGKEGKIVKEIMESTSTNIHIPKLDDPTSIIRVSGTTENIRLAVSKLQLIADEKAKLDFVKLPILKAFHPLIAGYQQSFIKSLVETHGVRIHLPPYNVAKDEISVSGEKDAVARAAAALEAQYQLKQQTCGELPVPIDKAKHKYIRGPKGAAIEAIFKSTGVHVELPALDSADNTVLLRGDTSKLADALALVYEKANSMTTVTIKAPDWLHRHIIGPKGAHIKALSEAHPDVYVKLLDNDTIDVEGPPASATAVAQELKAKVAELLGRLTFAEVKGNPQFFRHLIGRDGSTINKIKQETGVQINLPANDGVSDTIRIEGPPAGVPQAKAAIEAILKKLADSKTIDVIIEQRYHSQLIGAKGSAIKETIEKFGGISLRFPENGEVSDIIVLRGDKKNVEACEKYLKAEIKRIIESSYVLEVPLFTQFIKFIIGKSGATLTQIKEETDTRISIPKDSSETAIIKITGTQKNCEAARDRILKIQQDQANIVTETIEIDPKFHNGIIGPKGKVLKDIILQCGGVAVTFPKEKGSSKVTVRGDREDVDKAKAALLELANEKALSSFTLEVPVKKQFHRFIIGQKGAFINKIKDATGCRVIFPASQDEEADTVTIIGKEAQCGETRDKILARVKELESIVEETVEVPAAYHRNFFIRQGALLKEITDEFGVVVNFPRDGETVTVRGGIELVAQAIARINQIVQDIKEEVTQTVAIPAVHHGFVLGAAGKNVIRIQTEFNVSIKFPKRKAVAPKGADAAPAAKADGDAAPAATEAAASSEPAAEAVAEAAPVEDAEVVDVPAETLYSVDATAPDSTAAIAAEEEPQIPVEDRVVIKGKAENIEKAHAALRELIPETETVEVAAELHGGLIGPKGETIRKLMLDNDVNIKVPNNTSGLNTITIKGLRANIFKAKYAIAKLIVQLEGDKAERALRSFKVEVAVPAKYHASIIGRLGAGIQKLRAELDVQFDFPKKAKEGSEEADVIVVTGYEAKANKARDVLLAKVAELDKLVSRDLQVDSRVHSRIIGGRGAGVKALQEKYKVRVLFPKDKDAGIITVTGQFDDVEDAANEILNKAEEYMEEVQERESQRVYEQPPSKSESKESKGSQEFKIRDAPWQSDDVASFPTLGSPVKKAAPTGVWGRK